jgi:hypothetical protein
MVFDKICKFVKYDLFLQIHYEFQDTGIDIDISR